MKLLNALTSLIMPNRVSPPARFADAMAWPFTHQTLRRHEHLLLDGEFPVSVLHIFQPGTFVFQRFPDVREAAGRSPSARDKILPFGAIQTSFTVSLWPRPTTSVRIDHPASLVLPDYIPSMRPCYWCFSRSDPTHKFWTGGEDLRLTHQDFEEFRIYDDNGNELSSPWPQRPQ